MKSYLGSYLKSERLKQKLNTAELAARIFCMLKQTPLVFTIETFWIYDWLLQVIRFSITALWNRRHMFHKKRLNNAGMWKVKFNEWIHPQALTGYRLWIFYRPAVKIKHISHSRYDRSSLYALLLFNFFFSPIIAV